MTSEPEPTSTAAASAPVTVVGRANRRRLFLYMCVNLAVVAYCVIELIGSLQPMLIVLLVLVGLATWVPFKLLRRPPQMTVADGRLTLRVMRGPRVWPVEDVIALEQDADTTRLAFKSVAQVEPPRLRRSLEKQFERTGYHVQLVGPFTAAQVDEMRSALGMLPLPPSRHGSLADFFATAQSATPRAFVTWLLLAANLIVFAAMAIGTRSLLQPTTADLIAWGADYGPLTTGSQPWRLFTAMFLHAGLLHLLVNMFALYYIGPLLELLYGNLGVATVYLLSGLSGSIASVYWHPAAVGVGASGAIFGLFGALGAFLLRHQRTIPAPVIRRYRGVTIAIVAFNLLFGLSDSKVDNAAHLGGLVAGFVVGLLLDSPAVGASRGRCRRRVLLTTLVGIAAVAMAVHLLQARGRSVELELRTFSETETSVLDHLDQAEQRLSRGAITDGQYIAVLQAEGIERWGHALSRLAALRNVPQPEREYWSQTIRYATLRRDGWQLLVNGLATNDNQLIADGQKKQAEADDIVTEMNRQQKSK